MNNSQIKELVDSLKGASAVGTALSDKENYELLNWLIETADWQMGLVRRELEFDMHVMLYGEERVFRLKWKNDWKMLNAIEDVLDILDCTVKDSIADNG